MLVELRIRDYAVVEDLSLTLGPGLNALTGETGAGKSIIVGALSLLLGERASSGVVRAGAPRASVEAVFDVSSLSDLTARMDELGYPPEDGLLILRREVAAEGRNRAWVNGSPATAGVVGTLGSALVDLHGQHEHQTLLRPAEQRGILDAFSGSAGQAGEVARMHAELQEVHRELESREERLRDIESRADFLRFQLGEMDGAKPSPGEDLELDAEARRHEHAEELAQGAGSVHEMLYGGDGSVADRIAEARATLSRLARFDEGLTEVEGVLDEAFHAVNEAGRRMGDYAASVEHDPARLEEVRARLDLLFRLKRKYGPELADVLATAQRVRAELEELEEADHDLEEVRTRAWSLAADLDAAAADLSSLRRQGAERLAAAIMEVLPELGLPDGTFQVDFSELDGVGPGGAEAVEFLVALNAGFEPMPLRRVASGGEMSRIMLALKSVLAGVDRVPVLVFDEIDAGIGGVVATAVGEKLARVAHGHQVFVVTHLAQLASRASGHFMVEKGAGSGLTTATVRALAGDARVEEIARMLGGDPGSATSREHAKELLETR
jgi:DNA repair protein RecN (Recombination protein N)